MPNPQHGNKGKSGQEYRTVLAGCAARDGSAEPPHGVRNGGRDAPTDETWPLISEPNSFCHDAYFRSFADGDMRLAKALLEFHLRVRRIATGMKHEDTENSRGTLQGISIHFCNSIIFKAEA